MPLKCLVTLISEKNVPFSLDLFFDNFTPYIIHADHPHPLQNPPTFAYPPLLLCKSLFNLHVYLLHLWPTWSNQGCLCDSEFGMIHRSLVAQQWVSGRYNNCRQLSLCQNLTRIGKWGTGFHKILPILWLTVGRASHVWAKNSNLGYEFMVAKAESTAVSEEWLFHRGSHIRYPALQDICRSLHYDSNARLQL
jgi:hypothetical protein